MWKKSSMVVGSTDFDCSCQVRIDENEIVVSYINDEENGWVNYKGKDNGDGHFKLECPEIDGEATLHLIRDEDILEGHWVEGGDEGFWRIKLSD